MSQELRNKLQDENKMLREARTFHFRSEEKQKDFQKNFFLSKHLFQNGLQHNSNIFYSVHPKT